MFYEQKVFMCKENSFFADVRDETRWPPSASLETFDFKRPLGMTRDLFIFLLDVFGFKVKWNGWANIVRFFYCCVESYKVGPNCGVMDNGHCVLGLRLSLLSYFLIDLQLDDDEFGCVTVGGAHAIHLYTDIITKHMVFFLSLSSYLKQHPPTFFLRIFSCYCVQWEKKRKEEELRKRDGRGCWLFEAPGWLRWKDESQQQHFEFMQMIRLWCGCLSQ